MIVSPSARDAGGRGHDHEQGRVTRCQVVMRTTVADWLPGYFAQPR